MLVEVHIGEVALQHGGARVALVEGHQLGLAQMHVGQRGPEPTAADQWIALITIQSVGVSWDQK